MALILGLCCLMFAPAPLPQRHREPQLHLEGTWDELGGPWRIVTFWPGGKYECRYGKYPNDLRWVGFWELSGRKLTVWQWVEGDDEQETACTWTVELDASLSGIKVWPDKTQAGYYCLSKPKE